jgi:hypothetical protein
MPRYFFHFHSNAASMADLVGRDLPDATAAKAEAVKQAADLATNAALEGRLPEFAWVEVVDDCDRPISRLPVADAIKEPNRLR